MALSIRSTQQFANAAETFVSALHSLFPGNTFDQFFHGDTLRQAYWTALRDALDRYTTIENAPFAHTLLSGQVLSDPRVVAELLKLFLPGQTPPDYELVARCWQDVSPSESTPNLIDESQRFLRLLADELWHTADIRLALQRLTHVRSLSPGEVPLSHDDLDRLLDAALVSGPGTLVRQIRHLLELAAPGSEPMSSEHRSILAALSHLAPYLDQHALTALWDEASRLDDPSLRLRLISALAPYYARMGGGDALALLRDAFQAVAPVDADTRVDVLLTLLPHLARLEAGSDLTSLQSRLLEVVETIDDPASRVRALTALMEKLTLSFQYDAVSRAFETASCCIPNEMARAAVLSMMPPHLPSEFYTDLVDIARALTSPDARALLMGRMIPYLPAGLRHDVLLSALNAIGEISGDESRAAALIALVPQVESLGSLESDPEALQQAIQVIFSIMDADSRARAFSALAPYLSSSLIVETLPLVKQIVDARDQALVLSRLAPRLSDDLNVAAFNIAQQITVAEARATALVAIAPYLSPLVRSQALADALVAALSIERRYDRVVALVDLAPHLPADLHQRALQEAMTAARSIPAEDERGQALVFLVPHLPEDRLADALADAYTILNPLDKAPVLAALLPYLPPEPRHRVAQDAIKMASEILLEQVQASILAALAPVLPDEHVKAAVQLAAQIKTPHERAHVLTALLARQPEQLREETLAAVRAVPDVNRRVNALLDLIPHLPPAERLAVFNEALELTRTIGDSYDRASALSSFALVMDARSDSLGRQQAVLDLALDTCMEVTNAEQRAALLSRVVPHIVDLLSPAQCYPLWRRLVASLRRESYLATLLDLAALAPLLDHMGAATGAEEIAALLRDLV